MNEDHTKGQAKDVGGKVKEGVGKATGDRQTEQSGKADQAEGSIQKGIAKVKDIFRK